MATELLRFYFSPEMFSGSSCGFTYLEKVVNLAVSSLEELELLVLH